jgi:hypothetical protein
MMKEKSIRPYLIGSLCLFMAIGLLSFKLDKSKSDAGGVPAPGGNLKS